MESKKLKEQGIQIVKETPIADIHTHIYSEAFGDLLLWGIDELLTYHSLIAELFRYKPELDYETFWNMPKQKQAELIWEEMFIKNSPISEAARGVVTVLNGLGLDASDKNLNKILNNFQQYSKEINNQGFKIASDTVDAKAVSSVKDFLKAWIEKINPMYMAVSLPPDFRIDDGGTRAKLILECVLPIAQEHKLPFAMMIC